MGLFDRFKKNKNSNDNTIVKEVNDLVKHTNDFIDEVAEAEKKLQEEEKNASKKAREEYVKRKNKEQYYRALHSRLVILKKLSDENKIKIFPQALDALNKWLDHYQEQMKDVDELDLFADVPDFDIPDFPVTSDDIFYPKNNFMVPLALKDILEYENIYEDVKEMFSMFESRINVIKSDDELAPLTEGINELNDNYGRHR